MRMEFTFVSRTVGVGCYAPRLVWFGFCLHLASVWLAGENRRRYCNEMTCVIACRKDKSAVVDFDLISACSVLCCFLLADALVAVLFDCWNVRYHMAARKGKIW